MSEFTLVRVTLNVKCDRGLSDNAGADLSMAVRSDIDDALDDLAKELEREYPEIKKVTWNT